MKTSISDLLSVGLWSVLSLEASATVLQNHNTLAMRASDVSMHDEKRATEAEPLAAIPLLLAQELYGGSGPDTITGGKTSDQIYGDAGNDTISGDAGSDDLSGESGEDTITGGGQDSGLGDLCNGGGKETDSIKECEKSFN
jgi:hypothetical protein